VSPTIRVTSLHHHTAIARCPATRIDLLWQCGRK
jgi:hypothetical protein